MLQLILKAGKLSQKNLKQAELPVLRDSQVIEEVINILIDEDKWTQKTFARDALDNKVDYKASVACKFCVVGAMRNVVDDARVIKITSRMATILKYHGVTYWNDLQTHQSMITGLRNVYETFRQEESV